MLSPYQWEELRDNKSFTHRILAEKRRRVTLNQEVGTDFQPLGQAE